jgi:redox-sensitive bicupin YhaK (pirin superfamily)
MDHLKKVASLLPAVEVDMGGFPVKQPIPTHNVDQVDPFLLLHHARTKFSNSRPAKVQGIGPHPHRGFSPVTFIIDGEIHHRDSRGNDQIAKAGEVQWMHAGAGIVHSERPSEKIASAMEHQEIIQLWINSPAKNKMLEPAYQYLAEDLFPLFHSEDKKIKNKIVAGSFNGVRGPAITQSEVLILWGESMPEGVQKYTLPENDNLMLYLIDGAMKVSGFGTVEKEHLIVFETGGDQLSVSFQQQSQFLIFCGTPINEEVTQYGPFVMNTQTEILEAMRDYQMGKMGILIEE